MKKILLTTIAAATLTVGLTGCVNDLDIHSIDPQTSSSATDMGLLAKCYATLGLTGQKGPAGNGDLSDDEGESGFYRTTFNCMQLMTDECAWAWQNDDDMKPFTTMSWTSGSNRTKWVYTRLTYDITLFNSYLQQVADNEANSQYRAEVRFLRALHYWYLLDLFGKSPFKNEFNITDLPVERSGNYMYQWLDQELTEIEPLMAEPGSFCNSENFGRADRAAAWMLHARLALNCEVYSDSIDPRTEYQKAINYCDQLINNSGYHLSDTETNGFSGYQQLFMADNDENPKAMREIILPIRQDGAKTRNYGGAQYVVNSMRTAGMPNMGTTNGWGCLFARRALVQKFFPTLSDCPISTEAAPAGATEADIIALDQQDGSSTAQIIAKAKDDRALFYAGRGGGVRTLYPEEISSFTSGLSIVKWDNHRTDGQPTHDPTEYPDVDMPLMRLAEAYLTRAEAKWRYSGKLNDALADINVIRNRAHATSLSSIASEMDILDEWCREFYVEGRRRSDLVRFGCFTSSKYIWDWKGGVANGTSVDSHYNVFPIPYNELLNNENMTQNPGY